MIAIVGLAAAAVAFAASYLWTPRYVSATHVLVRGREARFLSTNGQNLNQQSGVMDASLAKSLGQTYGQMITSRSLAEVVVDELALDRRPADTSFMGQARHAVKHAYNVVRDILVHGYYAEPPAHEGAVMAIQRNLTATPVQDSYTIEVKAGADDPRLAAAIANTATAKVIAMITERDQAEAAAYRDFMKQQVDRAAIEVTRASQAVREYKQANDLTDISEQLKLDAQSDQQVRNKLRDTDIDLAANRAKYDALQASLNSIAATDATTSTVTTGRSTTTLTNTASSPIYTQLRTELAETAAAIAALQAQHDSVTALLNSQGTTLPQKEAELRDLELKLQTANGAYTAVRNAYEAALVNSQDRP
ncbi:MAG TPA: Wzz/FepE/Etk N-terminal domain-containing protein, partial [Candidatus Acidoferrales bacterium]|nr:Wzz/FepE/Etk N-terminal domain-containing protein [Candidatus Acidoferrales bacterium]